MVCVVNPESGTDRGRTVPAPDDTVTASGRSGRQLSPVTTRRLSLVNRITTAVAAVVIFFVVGLHYHGRWLVALAAAIAFAVLSTALDLVVSRSRANRIP